MTEKEIREIVEKSRWGFLRETDELAKKAGIDNDTGLFRTGLPTYLKEIYPRVTDWVHDKVIPHSGRLLRPDYRSETLKMIIEFDGFPHYQQPDTIKKDGESKAFYETLGYKVVRIPYLFNYQNLQLKFYLM